jgi:hypothetical protein
MTAGTVREVALPSEALELTTLSRVDYADAYLLETGAALERSGEEWARALLEGAPAATRQMLRRGWFALGVRLGSTEDERLVLGWAVRRSSPDLALLAASSLIGMEAELLLRREPGALLFATIMQLKNPLVRPFWARFSPQHRRVVRHLLRQLDRRTSAGVGRPSTVASRT